MSLSASRLTGPWFVSVILETVEVVPPIVDCVRASQRQAPRRRA